MIVICYSDRRTYFSENVSKKRKCKDNSWKFYLKCKLNKKSEMCISIKFFMVQCVYEISKRCESL